MFNFISKVGLVFSYGDELEKILKEKKQVEKDRIRKRDSQRLSLCEDHNPTYRGLANYAKHNCDYCNLLKELNELKSNG